TEHPVLFVAVTKTVLNSLGWQQIGVTDPSSEVPNGEVEFENGRPVLMRGGQALVRGRMPSPRPHPPEEVRAKHEELVAVYNSVGITSIFERATNRDGFDFLRQQAR